MRGPFAVACLCGCSLLASAQVASLYRLSKNTWGSRGTYERMKVAPGQEVTLADLDGPGKITHFYFTDGSPSHLFAGLVLSVFWDGEATPSIEAPLADFFGAIGGTAVDYQTPVMQINHYNFASNLPMPFARRARFVLRNDSSEIYERLAAYAIDYERGDEFRGEPSRLHALWKRSNPVPDGAVHTILEASGQGHYVGNFLEVRTGFDGWWGEGDTIFTVDGQRVTHTQGTEDEYCSCWGFEHAFGYEYCGYQPVDKARNRMYRWYIPNPVRFRKSLKVEIQNQHYVPSAKKNADDFRGGQQPAHDDYISIAYWYQTEPHQTLSLPPHAERTAPSQLPQREAQQ